MTALSKSYRLIKKRAKSSGCFKQDQHNAEAEGFIIGNSKAEFAESSRASDDTSSWSKPEFDLLPLHSTRKAPKSTGKKPAMAVMHEQNKHGQDLSFDNKTWRV